MNTTIAATKARQQFFKLISQAEAPGTSITITVDGNAKVVMMSAEEFYGWQETLEIISDPKLMKGIKEGINNLKDNQSISHEQLKKELNV